MLQSPKLQKLLVDSLVILQSVIFFKTGPFVKQNNAEFTNVSCCTSLLMRSAHFTLSYRVLSFPLPTSNNFFQFVCSEITRVCLVDPVLLPLVLFASLAFGGHQNLTWLLSGLLISKTLLPHAGSSSTLLFCL